jgi:ABC-type branched-subunit amino acid transport system substrate-binding protein
VNLKALGAHRVCLALAACVVIGLVVAGCGGGGSSSGSTESGSTTSAGGGEPSPSGEPVKLGMIAPQATAVNLSAEIAAVKSAVNALNKRGGLEGRPVELVYCDDKADPNVTTSCGREMVEEEVIAVVGGGAINGNLLVPILEKAEIPALGVTATDPQELNAKDYFYFTAGPPLGAIVTAAYLGQAGLKSALFSTESPTAQGIIELIENTATQAGTPLTSVVEVPAEQADYAPIVAAGKPEESNAAMLFMSFDQDATLIKTGLGQGWSPTWLLPAEPQPAVAEAYGGPVTNTVYPSPFPPITPESKNPEILRYLEELEAGVSEGVEHAEEALAHPTYTGLDNWLTVQVIEQLVEEGKVKELTGPGMLKALLGVKDLDIGLLKSWSPNTPGPEGFSRISNTAYNLIEINEGKYVSLTKEPVTAEELASGEVSVPPPAGAK